MNAIDAMKKIIAGLDFYGQEFLDWLLFHGGKFAGRFIWPLVIFRNPERYVYAESYYPEFELKGRNRILLEQLWYVLKTGEINRNYFLYGFDRKDKQDQSEYVPWLDFAHARDRKNKRSKEPNYDFYNYVCLLKDKILFEAYCYRLKIKTPVNLAYIKDGKFYSYETDEYLNLKKIMDYNFDAFLKKNVSYGGGMSSDVMPLQIVDRIIEIAENRIGFEEFEKLIGEGIWVIQKRIREQHEGYSCFHESSINTLRVISVSKDSRIEIIGAKLRMGANNSYNDNTSSGGLSVGIDIATGALEKYGVFMPGKGKEGKVAAHPNSGIVFEGYILPLWDEVKQAVLRIHEAFYGIYSIGWDVCVTPEGPLFIEGNDNWDCITLQQHRGAKSIYKRYFV